MMKFGLRQLAAVAVCVSSGFVYGITSDYSSYVQLETTETAWDATKNAWVAGDHWSDKSAPDSSKDYYVPSGLQMYLNGNNAKPLGSFGGRRLAVAGTLYINVASGVANDPVLADLVCLDGSEIDVASQYAPFGLVGTTVDVQASLADPLTIDFLYENANAGNSQFKSAFTGSGAFVFTRSALANGSYHLLFPGIFDLFKGTMIVSGAGALVKQDSSGPFSSAGDVAVRDGGVFYPFFNWQNRAVTSTATMRSLSVEDGGAVAVYVTTKDSDPIAWPYYVITNALSFEKGGAVRIDNMLSTQMPGASSVEMLDTVAKTWKIFELHGPAVGADLSNLRVELAGDNMLCASDAVKWCPVRLTDAYGVETVSVGYTNLVVMNTVSSSVAGKTALYPGNGSYWSVGRVPTSDDAWDIFVSSQFGIGAEDVDLPKATLSVVNGTRIAWGTSRLGDQILRVKEIHLPPDAEFIRGSDGVEIADARHIYADFIRVYRKPYAESAAYINASYKTPYVIHAPFDGKGDFRFKKYNSDTGVTRYVLMGDSSAYAGRFIIGDATGNADSMHRVAVCIDAVNQLGGTVCSAAPTWKAVEITGDSQLKATDDVTFDAAGRGMFFNVKAGIEVAEGKTLTLKNKLAFGGMLTKTGSGTLRFASASRPTFGDGSNLTSLANTNRLHVAEGAVSFGALNSGTGLELSFAPGASLQLDLAATGDSQKYGLFNWSWNRPFALDAGGKIPVSFTGTSSARSVKLAICTVSGKANTDLGLSTESFAFKHFKGWAVKEVSQEVMANGRVIYSVTLERKDGFVLTIR